MAKIYGETVTAGGGSGGYTPQSGIPDYWEEHLADKIARIKSLQDQHGKDCFSYVVMTDMHYPSNLGKNAPLLAKKIIDECNIKYALILGDVRNRGCWATKEQAQTEWDNVEEMLAPLKSKILMTQGNHDAGYGTGDYDGDGDNDTFAYEFTPAEMFERVYRKAGRTGNAVYDASGTAFYVDDIANKVRYILLNTQLNFDGNIGYDSYETVGGMAKYPSMWKFRYTQCQYDFLVNDALATIPNDNWKVIIGSHVPINQSGEMPEYAVMVGVLNAYQNKATYNGSYAGTASGGAVANYTNLLTSENIHVGYRINSGGSLEANSTTSVIAIPLESAPLTTDVFRIKGLSALPTSMRYAVGSSVQWESFKPTGTSGSSHKQYQNTTYLSTSTDENGDLCISLKTDLSSGQYAYIAFTLDTVDSSVLNSLIVTVNEPIVESTTNGYDAVSVSCDFTSAKGKIVCYNAGHVHEDKVSTTCYPSGNLKFPLIMTRCDAKEENDTTLNAERVAGTITEQSFDVFTVTPSKIYATKIGAGADREISY